MSHRGIVNTTNLSLTQTAKHDHFSPELLEGILIVTAPRHKHISPLIASAIDHDLSTPVWRGGGCPHNDIAMPIARISVTISLSSVPFGLLPWASLSLYLRLSLSLHFRHNLFRFRQ